MFKITFILQLILQDLNKIILGLKGLWVNGTVRGMWWLNINFSQPGWNTLHFSQASLQDYHWISALKLGSSDTCTCTGMCVYGNLEQALSACWQSTSHHYSVVSSSSPRLLKKSLLLFNIMALLGCLMAQKALSTHFAAFLLQKFFLCFDPL